MLQRKTLKYRNTAQAQRVQGESPGYLLVHVQTQAEIFDHEMMFDTVFEYLWQAFQEVLLLAETKRLLEVGNQPAVGPTATLTETCS